MTDRAAKIFAEVIGGPEGARGAALENACRGDPDLRARVEVMLRAHNDAEGFLGHPTREGSPPAAPARSEEGPGSVVGRYKLLQLIGEGGFGRVFMAEQREPVVRRVALKVLKLGMDTRQVVARFEAERQALALMDHPGIATVLDGGATESGRPFFVMELVHGVPITEYCDGASMAVADRLELFREVCAAVQHAHQKGVVHRDLKPGNVLVAERDGRARPKVIDFGIAKAISGRLTDRTLFTEFRQFIGTPQYMSPEQTLGAGADVDTRSDVYSLGVVLYELLTGTTPLDPESMRHADLAEIQRMIREDETPRPSTRVSTARAAAQVRRTEPRKLGVLLRGDLDWIVLKSLDKDRNRRYETVAALAEDIRRFLAHEPVSATPPGATYRLRKFVRRHRGPVIAGGLVAGALLVGLAGTGAGLVWAMGERDRANVQAGRAVEVKQFLESMLLSASPWVALGEDTTLMRRVAEQASSKLEAGAIDDPEIEAELGRTIAQVFMQIGDFTRAEPLARRATETLRAKRGPGDAGALEAAHLLAQIVHELNRLDEADVLASGVLEGRRRVLGPSDPETIDAMVHLGELRRFQGRFDEAEAFAREALGAATATLGEDHERTLTAMKLLAFVLSTRGPSPEIEPLMRKAWDGLRRTLGEDHPSTVEAERHLAGFVGQRLGRMDECEALLRDALERTIRVSGEEHSAAINLRSNLGATLNMLGRPEEAEPILRRAWETGRRRFGPAHEMALFPGAELARVLTRLDRLEEAEALHRETTAGMRRLLGDAHFETLGEISSLAALLRQRGKAAEAEPLIVEALAGMRAARGESHAETLRAMRRHAAILTDLGRFDEAERELIEADGLLRAARPDAGEEIRVTARAFAELYEAWDTARPGAGHDASAAEWREKAANPG